MENKQQELQTKLEELLGSRNVYYQPPESLKMQYPAIRYELSTIQSNNADNIKYSKNNRYQITVIDRLPDNEVISKILDLPYTSYDRRYKANNLNHDVITIYY